VAKVDLLKHLKSQPILHRWISRRTVCSLNFMWNSKKQIHKRKSSTGFPSRPFYKPRGRKLWSS